MASPSESKDQESVPTPDGFPLYGSQEYSEMVWKWTQIAQKEIQYAMHDALSNIELWHIRRITDDVARETYLSRSMNMPVIEEIRERFWLVCYGTSYDALAWNYKYKSEIVLEYLNRLRWHAHNLLS